jgi:hypothetical protein
VHLKAPLADHHRQVGAVSVLVHVRELRHHGGGVLLLEFYSFRWTSTFLAS